MVAIRFVVTRFVDARFVVTDVVVIRLVVTEVVVTWFVVTEAVVTCFDAVWFVAATRAGPLVGTTRLVRAATGRGGTGTWAIKPGARISARHMEEKVLRFINSGVQAGRRARCSFYEGIWGREFV